MCVKLTVGNGWGVQEIDNKAYYGFAGYREAIAKFEEAIDKGKFAQITVAAR